MDILSSGLWDGEDKAGRAICGTFEFGICKQCGGRCAKWEDGHSFVPTDEEWQRHFAPQEKWRKRAESWPFEPEDDNHVAQVAGANRRPVPP